MKSWHQCIISNQNFLIYFFLLSLKSKCYWIIPMAYWASLNLKEIFSSILSPPFTRFMFTRNSISSVYTLTSPLFTRFWVKIYSIILFTWFSIYAVFLGKQNMCKLRSRGRIWILKNSNFGGKYYTYWCLCILHVSFEIELSLLVNRGSTHFSENLKTYVV